ncbi:transmembrane and TPR repeat-containing protein CG4050-like [Limulus polyphemus]|uniref:dolichyl-phosphate-mannose--protein mannosyltransferase n=1 Tax=Limulus polyphemus TaxID=6850 RepID=A0ABM1B848_LIMPO|nr:transmembrane and TPR repeat-containing protein CG4050-like [Limulus polyphemus]XP_022244149.1 transmembrane and TPR repeat-containing protein CG4050-like [Limulus polyphemus]
MSKQPDRFYPLAVAATALTVYSTSLGGNLVFDDVAAIQENRDVRPSSSLLNLFLNDFWGTPLQKEQSHKSYRPFTVFTFRLNYAVHGLQPLGYHMINVLLHALVCVLYYRLCLLFLPRVVSFVAAILFSVHPIHTEAVAGVVGRAELLSAVFFLSALSQYVRLIQRNEHVGWRCCIETAALAVCGTLCKEQCLTVLVVCAVYGLLSMKVANLTHLRQCVSADRRLISLWIRKSVARIGLLGLTALLMIGIRFNLMGPHLPLFNRFDNPASVSPFPTRQLTFSYLVSVNAWLLLFPCDLCCDWTMGTITLITSVGDPRNISTLCLCVVLVVLLRSSWLSEDSQRVPLLMALFLSTVTFLPASNLLFYVGFVIAERVLYLPSMGFCMLVAIGWAHLWQDRRLRGLAVVGVVLLVIAHGTKTAVRNREWASDETLFSSGLRVNQKNAKLYNNLGKVLEKQAQYEEALQYFQQAIRIQPDDIRGYLNSGWLFTLMKKYQEAELVYLKAKSLLPRSSRVKSSEARVTQTHLQLFLNLASLISRNHTRLEEADALYQEAIKLRSDYTGAYLNRGDFLMKINRTKEAEAMYEQALQFDTHNPDLYHNLGVLLMDQNKNQEALTMFNRALEIDPDHEQALVSSAILIQESDMALHHKQLASERLQKIVDGGKQNELIYFNLGMLALENKDIHGAEQWLNKALQVRPNLRSALFNLALLLSEDGRPLEAFVYIKRLLQIQPDHVKGLILMGDIYAGHFEDLGAAEECYKKILQSDPANIQGLHNLCVVYYRRQQLVEAEACFQQAHLKSPDTEYIRQHLEITRYQLQQLAARVEKKYPLKNMNVARDPALLQQISPTIR